MQPFDESPKIDVSHPYTFPGRGAILDEPVSIKHGATLALRVWFVVLIHQLKSLCDWEGGHSAHVGSLSGLFRAGVSNAIRNRQFQEVTKSDGSRFSSVVGQHVWDLEDTDVEGGSLGSSCSAPIL